MREIKCRGYNKELQKWIIGSYVDGYIVNGVMESNEEYIVIERWAPVEKESVGQYTGLKDKNGVEIYEGDMLEYTLDEMGDIGVVEMSDNGFWIVTIEHLGDFDPLCDWLDENVEILGNIYDNPELLKKED